MDWWVDKVEGKAELGAEMICAWDSLGMRSPVEIVEAVPGERLVLEWKEQPGVVVWEIAECVLDMSCEEIGGFVFLMCWQQRVWASITGWKLSAAEAEALEKELGGALDELVSLS